MLFSHLTESVECMPTHIILEGDPKQIQQTHDPVVHQFIHGFSKGPITEAVDTFN